MTGVPECASLPLGTKEWGVPGIKNMRTERLLRGILILVLTLLWLKLAFDLTFTNSTRSWFPLYTVILMAAGSLFFAILNVYVLAHGKVDFTRHLPKARKAFIIIVFLSSYFACGISHPLMKFIDMCFVVPAIVLLVIFARKNVSIQIHYILLILFFILLIPNDPCRNPQNQWWVDLIGVSPLMYILQINIFLYLTTEEFSKFIVKTGYVITVFYGIGAVYHALSGGGYSFFEWLF